MILTVLALVFAIQQAPPQAGQRPHGRARFRRSTYAFTMANRCRWAAAPCTSRPANRRYLDALRGPDGRR